MLACTIIIINSSLMQKLKTKMFENPNNVLFSDLHLHTMTFFQLVYFFNFGNVGEIVLIIKKI